MIVVIRVQSIRRRLMQKSQMPNVVLRRASVYVTRVRPRLLPSVEARLVVVVVPTVPVAPVGGIAVETVSAAQASALASGTVCSGSVCVSIVLKLVGEPENGIERSNKHS